MNAESFLSSSVEVAVAIAGFAGIVSAVRHRNVAIWAEGERILLRMLLTASGMATLFALLPAVLMEAKLPEAMTWRICSVSLLVWQLAIAVRRARQFRTLEMPLRLPVVLQVWVVAAWMMQVANIVLATAWPFLLGVFSLIANAFTFFLVLLLGRSDEEGAEV